MLRSKCVHDMMFTSSQLDLLYESLIQSRSTLTKRLEQVKSDFRIACDRHEQDSQYIFNVHDLLVSVEKKVADIEAILEQIHFTK